MGRKIKAMVAQNDKVVRKWQRSWQRLVEIHKAQLEAKEKKRKLAGIPIRAVPVQEVIDDFDIPLPAEAVKPAKKGLFYSRSSYIDWLTKKGFKSLGAGFYSSVLHKKGDRVIKVGTPDGWIDYILWASKAGWSGKYAPKVFSYKLHNKGKYPFFVAVMEKLDTTIRKMDSKQDAALLPGLFSFATERQNPLAGTLLDLVFPGLNKFADGFYQSFKGRGLDLHGGNFMVRNDGSFVLTDPIAGHCKYKGERLRTPDLQPSNDNQEVRIAA